MNIMNRLRLIVIMLTLTFVLGCRKKEEVTFPQITTDEITEIGTHSLTAGGTIVSDGNAAIIASGICWGDTDSPMITNANVIADSSARATGSFKYSISNLMPGYVYYFRAFASNSFGIAYGSVVSASTAVSAPEVADSLYISLLTPLSVIVNGYVNPMSLSTAISFEYGLTTNYGRSAPADQSPLISRGLCWVRAKLNDLSPASTYHFRIKAENKEGTSFSADQTFNTPGSRPLLLNTSISDITINTVKFHTWIDPALVETSVTVEYGTSQGYGSTFTVTPAPITASKQMDFTVDNLLPNTDYYLRVKAVNLVGTTYSNEFRCKTYSFQDIDHNYYHTVKAGTQEWLQENLKTLHYQNGDPIAVLPFDNDWANASTGACTYYNYDLDLGKKYGFLYNYYAATDTRNVCPAGWHVPTQSEWTVLINYAGGESVAAPKLRIAGISNWNPLYYTEADNSTGLTISGSGKRQNTGEYWGMDYNATLWTTTPWTVDPSFINTMRIFENQSNTEFSPEWKNAGAGIRCLKN